MKYLLDTNAVIAILNDVNSSTARELLLKGPSEVAVSCIVTHELYYGAFKSQKVEKNVGRIDSLQFQMIEFNEFDARAAGEIRAQLALKGTPIGPLDVLIAAQALTRGLILVTHNTHEFARIKGLRMEDWQTD